MKCAIIFLLFACSVWAVPVEETSVSLADSNRHFTAGVYREILKTVKGNLIFSPFSAQTILALLTAGANGPTYDELITGLSLPSSQESIQKEFKQYLPKLTSNTEDLKLLSANKIYAGQNVKLENEFQKVAVDIYNSAVQKVNFAQNVEAAATMNKWVEQQTNEKIKDLISQDDIDSDTALVLINALYFSGKWTYPFAEYATRPEKFYKTANEHVEVPTMSQIGYFNYYDNSELGAQFLELPYEAEGLSMVIVLPHEKQGLTALEQNMDKILQVQPLKRERVDIKLPKICIESEIKFKPILEKLGINLVFTDKADLSKLSSTHKDLFVSKVLQKAFINVTEFGTEAAAATAVQVNIIKAMFPHRPVEPKLFYADHPFGYHIIKDGVILFGGRVSNAI